MAHENTNPPHGGALAGRISGRIFCIFFFIFFLFRTRRTILTTQQNHPKPQKTYAFRFFTPFNTKYHRQSNQTETNDRANKRKCTSAKEIVIPEDDRSMEVPQYKWNRHQASEEAGFSKLQGDPKMGGNGWEWLLRIFATPFFKAPCPSDKWIETKNPHVNFYQN